MRSDYIKHHPVIYEKFVAEEPYSPDMEFSDSEMDQLKQYQKQYNMQPMDILYVHFNNNGERRKIMFTTSDLEYALTGKRSPDLIFYPSLPKIVATYEL